MDEFLSEIFDVRGVDHQSFVDPITGGLSHTAMMGDPRLVMNAAFRYAWRHLSGGAFPSARCFAEFVLTLTPANKLEPDLGVMTRWILTSPDGPFYIMQGTKLLSERLSSLEDGRFISYMGVLKEAGGAAVHQSEVEKMVDRHLVLEGSDTLQKQVNKYMKKPLYLAYRTIALASVPGGHAVGESRNLASGMIASHEEERADPALAIACRAPLRVGRGDAIKRRFSRDIHFQKRQFGKPYVTASRLLMEHAEVVRMAIGAPWAVNDECAREVEQHSPVIASACVRLHTYDRGGVGPRAPAPIASIASNSAVLTGSLLILFGAGADVSDAELVSFGESLGYQRTLRAHVNVNVNVSDRKPRCRIDNKKKLVYPLFFGLGGVEHWSYGILASSLRKHLVSPCPLLTLDKSHAHLLVDRCVTSVAISKGVLCSGFSITCSPLDKARYVLLAIDTRLDPSATILSVMVALTNLEQPADWAVRIMCSRKNRHEFERMLCPMCPSATFDQDSPELNVPEEAFDVEFSYNALMKNPSTWRALLPAGIVLTVQDDGLLMRGGVEKLMDDLVYLGAPWADGGFNACIKATVPNLVGNGGLSLRNVHSMIKLSEGVTEDERNRLFHTRSQQIPEDVMYASLAHADNTSSNSEVKVATDGVKQVQSARLLSCEQVPHAAALGFHKPWPYWSVTDTYTHMEMLMGNG